MNILNFNIIKHILDREEIWNKWKNEGCPNFVKEKRASTVEPKKVKRPKILTSDFDNGSTRQFTFNNSEIGKLCSVNHDNLNACKDPNRQFLPSLKEFFEEPIEQLDPENQVEKQYQLIYKTDWSWKALRLLAKRSAFYFMQNQNVRTIPEYLEAICHKLNKEFQSNVTNEQTGGAGGETNEPENTQINDEDNDNDNESVQLNDDQNNQNSNQNLQSEPNTNAATPTYGDVNEGNDAMITESKEQALTNEERLTKLKQEFAVDEYQEDSQSSSHSSTPPPPSLKHMKSSEHISILNLDAANSQSNKNDLVDDNFMNSIAFRITTVDEWKKIAQELNMDEDTIVFIEYDIPDVKDQCKKILLLWKVRLSFLFFLLYQ